MADGWTISGWIGTFAFGGISVFQFLKDIRDGGVWSERRKHLAAVKLGLVQLRATLVEAQETKRIIKTEPENQFISSLGHQIKTIEHHIDTMLEPEDLRPFLQPQESPQDKPL